jgi:hypothetical protein
VIVSACAIILLRLAEAGWPPFIMSRPDGDDTLYQLVMIAAISGFAFCGFAFCGVGVVATLATRGLDLPADLAMLMLLFFLWIALATKFTAQKGVLIWMNRIKAAASIEITGELMGGVVMWYACCRGLGFWRWFVGVWPIKRSR